MTTKNTYGTTIDKDTPAEPVETTAQSEGPRLLKRPAVANLLGVSESTVRRREGANLTPIVENGVHYYLEEEVLSLTTRRTLLVKHPGPTRPVELRHPIRHGNFAPENDDGERAAKVFDLLDEGVSPIAIVRRLRMSPDAVEALHAQWVRMNDGFLVSGAVKAELERLPWPRARPAVWTGEALAKAVRALVDTLARSGPVPCRKCRLEAASVCGVCVDKFSKEEERKTLVLKEELRAQREHEREQARHMTEVEKRNAAAQRDRKRARIDAECEEGARLRAILAQVTSSHADHDVPSSAGLSSTDLMNAVKLALDKFAK